MSTLTIDGGQLLLASEDERLISARLLPFGEECKSNLGRFTVDKGVLELPEDASVAIINDGHRRDIPVGAGVLYAEKPDGVWASWRIAQGKTGDAALADIKAGKRTAVSVEANVIVEGGKAVGGRIFGAALVTEGKQPAFPGALLMATAEEDAVADPEDPLVESYSNVYVDPVTGEKVESETTTEEEDEVDPDTGATVTTRTTTTITTTTPGTPPAEGSEAVPAQPTVPTEELLAERTPARVPATLRGKRPAKPEETPGSSYRMLLAMLAKAAPRHAHGSWNTKIIEQIKGDDRLVGTLYAELEDITYDAAGSPNDMVQPQWVGELWSGRSYQQRWIPLFASGPLTSPTVKGWRWVTKPEVDKWAGNKTDVPSGPIETEPYDVDAQPFAMAHDVDRRFKDFPTPEFWDGYLKAGTESYAKKSDLYVPDELFDVANAATTPIAGGAVPTGVSPVLAKIIDGALSILDEDLPSFAAVSLADFRALALTREQDNLAFLNTTLGLEEGSIASFRIVPTSHAALAGGKVLVGARSAATVHQLPGAPIRIEGLDVARGGIDPGLFGYVALAVHNPKALALVTPAA